MKKGLSVLLAILLAGLCACGSRAPVQKKWEVAVVTADAASESARALSEGVKAYNDRYETVNAWQDQQQFPPELQVPLVEDLIAQEVDALCVLPADQEALDPMLQKAQEQGIVVITFGGTELVHTDLDVEPTVQQKSSAVWDDAVLGEVLVALAAHVLEGNPVEETIPLDVEACPTVTIVPGTATTVQADCWKLP